MTIKCLNFNSFDLKFVNLTCILHTGHPKIAEILIKSGADINAMTDSAYGRETPLHIATSKSSLANVIMFTFVA